MFWPEIKSHGLRKPDISRKTFFLHSHKFMTGDTTQKLAILISADNAMPLAKTVRLMKAGLRQLDQHQPEWMEGRAPLAFNPANPAIRLHPFRS
jgi:hypothetical protein